MKFDPFDVGDLGGAGMAEFREDYCGPSPTSLA